MLTTAKTQDLVAFRSDFYTTPAFETGDPRYEWPNSVIAVGEGRFFNTGDGNFAAVWVLGGTVGYRRGAVVLRGWG